MRRKALDMEVGSAFKLDFQRQHLAECFLERRPLLRLLLQKCAEFLAGCECPVQVRILPVTDRHVELAQGLFEELRASHLRVEVSDTLETLPKRVREAEVERVPYIAVVGDQEIADGTVALRIRGSKGFTSLSRPEFIDRVSRRVRERAFEP